MEFAFVTFNSPAKVEVAVVEVAMKYAPRMVEVEEMVFAPVQSVIMPFKPEPEREEVLQVGQVTAFVLFEYERGEENVVVAVCRRE